jgi:hypothetical protein
MENINHPTFVNGKICYIEIPAINTSVAFTMRYSDGRSEITMMEVFLLTILLEK